MSQFAIIHTTSRVIRRLTTDVSPTILSDESAIDVTVNPINLAGGPWKLSPDNKTLVTPLQADIDSSGIDPVRNGVLAKQKKDTFNAAIDALLADTTFTTAQPKLATYLQAQRLL